ncbi:hypothetical protein NYE37_09085 [Thermoactinomyces sp. FSL K6-2592]|uniref:hypothetical protein n=1 Tax=Thermoactinomyces TaxID=2023 RepID=UPI0030F7DC3C
MNLLRKTNYIHTCASEGNGLKPNLLLLFSVTMCMRHMRKNMTHRLLMAIICMMIGMVIPLSPAISHAEGGGINVPSVDDHFYKPKEGPKPEEQKKINDENTKVETPEQKQQPQSKNEKKNDGPDPWTVMKFVINDFFKEQAASIEPYLYNPIDEISPKGAVYGNIVKIPRSAMGNLVFKDGSAGKIFIDTWDGAEKGKEVWDKYKVLKEIRNLENLQEMGSLLQRAEIQSQIGKLSSVSKLSKGLGWVGISVAAIDTGNNLIDTYKNWKAGKGAEARDAAIKAVGSFGEGLISAGALMGPTPWGIGLAAAGTVLWAGSAIWTHREGIKKMAQGAVDLAKKGVNAVKNGVKSAWNKLFG